MQAEDGIRDLVRSRGLGDVYKRQGKTTLIKLLTRLYDPTEGEVLLDGVDLRAYDLTSLCLLYTSDAADERSSVDLGGRRIITKKTPPPPGGGTS